MKKSAIFNLYMRQNQMKGSLEEIIREINRNEKLIEILNRASDEEKETVDMKNFTDTVQKQVDNFKEQKTKMEMMIDKTDEVIKLYESDKEKFAPLINSILVSFGFEEADAKD